MFSASVALFATVTHVFATVGADPPPCSFLWPVAFFATTAHAFCDGWCGPLAVLVRPLQDIMVCDALFEPGGGFVDRCKCNC